MCLCLAMIMSSWSYGQQRFWTDPPLVRDMTTGTTTSLPISTALNGYQGQTATRTHNGLFRRNGSPVFFTVDGAIYDQNGDFVTKFEDFNIRDRLNPIDGGFFPETHIIPVQAQDNIFDPDLNPCLLYLVMNGQSVIEIALDPITLQVNTSLWNHQYSFGAFFSPNPTFNCGFYGASVSDVVERPSTTPGQTLRGRYIYYSTCENLRTFWVSFQNQSGDLNTINHSVNTPYLTEVNNSVVGYTNSGQFLREFETSTYFRETEVTNDGRWLVFPAPSVLRTNNFTHQNATIDIFEPFNGVLNNRTSFVLPFLGEVKGVDIIEDTQNSLRLRLSVASLQANQSGIYETVNLIPLMNNLSVNLNSNQITRIAQSERSRYSMIESFANNSYFYQATDRYMNYQPFSQLTSVFYEYHPQTSTGTSTGNLMKRTFLGSNSQNFAANLNNLVCDGFFMVMQNNYVEISLHPLLILPKQIKGENITNTIDPEIPICRGSNPVLEIESTNQNPFTLPYDLVQHSVALNNPNTNRINVNLAGNFTISRDMTIRNVNFFMGGASTITILSGANVTFENCRFQACDILWRGMSANPGSSVSFTRVKFQHSFVGLTADAANVFIDDSDFEQNYFHLTLRNINRNRTQDIAITRSDFSCNNDIVQTFYTLPTTDNLCEQLPPLEDMIPTGTQRTAIAIRVEHSDIELGDASFETGPNNLLRNRINNAHVGINSWNSNTTVRGFDLRHIYEIGFNGVRPERDHLTLRSIRNKYSQMGVCLDGDVCFTNRPITGSEGSAIEALGNYSLFVHEDNMDRTNWWGIRYRGVNDLNTRKNLSVTNSDFKNTNFSAVFCYGAPATDILLDNNRFQYVPTLTGNFYQTPWMSGVAIEDITPTLQNTLILNNVFNNINSGLNIGFRTNPLILNNTFRLNGADLTPDRRRAINLTSLAPETIGDFQYSATVHNNIFRYFNDIIPASPWKDVAIEFSSCPYIDIRENDIYNIGRGIWSFDENLSSNIACNRFFDVDGAIAVIGNNGVGGIGVQGSETTPADNQWNKNTGFTPTFDTYTDGGVNGDAHHFFVRRSTTGPNARYRPTVNNFNIASNSLPITPDLSNPNTIGTCTFSSGKRSRLEVIALAQFNSPDPDLAYYNARYGLLWELKQDTTSDSLANAFVQQFQPSVLGNLTDAEIALSNHDSLSAAQALNLANCPCPRSVNSKIVLDIYNRTMAAGIMEYSSADSASLWNIATQDRKNGGRAVVQARNMIQALADTMYVWETDDQNLSNSANKMAQIEEKTEETNAKEFLINENQNLQLRALNPEQTYQMIVYSLDGKIILDQKLSNQTEANFSLSSGFYIARLYTANNNILTQKILIP